MPRIELIDPILFSPDDPIHWEIDNLPLKNIYERQNLINLALDNVIEEMRNAIGDQGSLANRLNQSINADGSLKTESINEALHSIEDHEDTDDFVRMTKEQSDKLDQIAEEATNLTLLVYTDGSSSVEFDAGTLKISASDSVTPTIVSPNILKFDLAFPVEAAHRHFYSLTPVHSSIVTPDYTNYKVNSSSSVFVDESLRIYVNGVRIFEDDDVYIPGALIDDPWTLLSYTSNYSSGTFELSTAISEDDIIKIDFDISFV